MDIKGKKILIIDDDEDIRSLYAEVFKREGSFEVEEAVDGLEGLDKAIKNVPDLIFSGIIMPKMDGFALKEALSKNVATANVPVVMSSHMGRKEDEVRAKEMGVKDFIIQGIITPKQAVERVKLILGSERYSLKFDPEELDALKLASNFDFIKSFKCNECGINKVIELRIADIDRHEFSARFVCLRCGK